MTDTLGAFRLYALAATPLWIEKNESLVESIDNSLLVKCTAREMSRLSSLSTPPDVVAVYYIPEQKYFDHNALKGLTVALDGVGDPGNFGTIIRSCSWFGISDIICSKDCVDIYNPKVVQSTMGSISAVTIHYVDALDKILFDMAYDGWDIYGTFMEGESLFTADLSDTKSVVVMGNEGHGISNAVSTIVNRRITIPRFAMSSKCAESLNVGVAASVVLSWFKGNG